MRNVLIITTGGTIASLSGKGPLNAKKLLGSVPQLSDYANVTHEEYCCIGSSKMSPELWLGLAKRINSILNQSVSPDGVVITHGTDTLEEAAFFLNLTLKSAKPVVLTGAMRPADHQWADGPLNLINAVRIAANDTSSNQGVLVALNEDIFAARDLTKSHNQKTDAFSLSHSGWIGYSDSKKVRFQYKSTLPHTLSSEFDVSELDELPKVSILFDYIGFDAENTQKLDDCAGVVIRTFAGGRCSAGMIKKIRQLTNQGTLVVLASRVQAGRITDLPFEVEGLIASNGHTENKSQILLILGLTQTKDSTELQRIFNTY